MWSIISKIVPFLFRKGWMLVVGTIAETVETVLRAIKNIHMMVLDWRYEYRTHPVHSL